jgi:hypothetical protein
VVFTRKTIVQGYGCWEIQTLRINLIFDCMLRVWIVSRNVVFTRKTIIHTGIWVFGDSGVENSLSCCHVTCVVFVGDERGRGL